MQSFCTQPDIFRIRVQYHILSYPFSRRPKTYFSLSVRVSILLLV